MAKKQKTPLALSDEMITALLEGRKRMTVRALNERDYKFWQDEDENGWPIYEDDYGDLFRAAAPYGPKGSYLWVRESYKVLEDGSVRYRQEDDPNRETPNTDWRPVVGQREAHSRFRLKVVGYQFYASVQDLTDDDLRRCGFSGDDVRTVFRKYWNKRYRSHYQKWEQNPAIWVARFKLLTRKDK